MIESIFTIIFVIIVLFIALRVKSFLYVNEHVQSIGDELNTFDENFKSIENIDKVSSYKLGSGHIYN